MFMSFRLTDAEKEGLAVICCLRDCKRIIITSPSYTILKSILIEGTDAHGWIARLVDCWTEYDYIVHPHPCKSNIMRIANGMSRIPSYYS